VIPLRLQLGLVAAAYAAVLGWATVLVYERYLQYVRHPEDVTASSGMYAFGDWMLALFIGCILLVPTFFLALIVRQSESYSTSFAKLVLAVSLTAPLCAVVGIIPALNRGPGITGEICAERLFCSPLVLVGLVMCRLLARFPRAKRLTSYALRVEILTLVVDLSLFFFLVIPLERH
jgi:hypothetical protein